MATDEKSPAKLKSELFCLLQKWAVKRLQVTLASGTSSGIYIDCRQVYFKGVAQFILGELFYQKMLAIEAGGHSAFDACGGMAMGAVPLACALSQAAFRKGRDLSGFAVRKEPKDHGMKSLVEGDKSLAKNCQVMFLEDVVTSGQSAIKAISALHSMGIFPDTLVAIVDRQQDGEKNLKNVGVTLHSFFKLSDFLE